MPDPILLQRGNYYVVPVHTYYIESDADAANIPDDAPVGSVALVNETGNFHGLMKDSNSEWNPMRGA